MRIFVLKKVLSLKVLKSEVWNVMESWRKYNLQLFTRQRWKIGGATGEMYIFKKALWIVLQQNDENIQLNVVIMSHVAFESLRNFSLRRWGGRYWGIKNEVSSRVITVLILTKVIYLGEKLISAHFCHWSFKISYLLGQF